MDTMTAATTTSSPAPRRLGDTGPTVAPLGLGLMGMSDLYGPADESESIATIHAALDAGVTLLDTGDFYGMGHNELLLREALRDRDRDERRDQRQVRRAARPGRLLERDRHPSGRDQERPRPDPPQARHRPRGHLPTRPARPGGPDRGDGRCARRARRGRATSGTSACPRWVRRPCAAPHAVHPIADLQIEYSLISRGIEAEILPVARELGVGITAYGVLSRGLLSGHWTRRPGRPRLPRPPAPLHRGQPRGQPAPGRGAPRRRRGPGRHRRAGRDRLGGLARGRDRAAGRRPHPGPARRSRSARSDLELSLADLAAIEAAVPADAAAGTRYDAAQMSFLDSEK